MQEQICCDNVQDIEMIPILCSDHTRDVSRHDVYIDIMVLGSLYKSIHTCINLVRMVLTILRLTVC